MLPTLIWAITVNVAHTEMALILSLLRYTMKLLTQDEKWQPTHVLTRQLYTEGLSKTVIHRGSVQDSYTPRGCPRQLYTEGLSKTVIHRGPVQDSYTTRDCPRQLCTEGLYKTVTHRAPVQDSYTTRGCPRQLFTEGLFQDTYSPRGCSKTVIHRECSTKLYSAHSSSLIRVNTVAPLFVSTL